MKVVLLGERSTEIAMNTNLSKRLQEHAKNMSTLLLT